VAGSTSTTVVVGPGGTVATTTTVAASGGALPFTGGPVGSLVLLALTLVSAGIALMASRQRHTRSSRA
jgi:hypothetical protein